jgi:hypothetical protein
MSNKLHLSSIFKGKKSREQHPEPKMRDDAPNSKNNTKVPPTTIEELLSCTENGVIFEKSTLPRGYWKVFDDIKKGAPISFTSMKIVETRLKDQNPSSRKHDLLHCRSFKDILKLGENDKNKKYMYQPYWVERLIGQREHCFWGSADEYSNWATSTKAQWEKNILKHNIEKNLEDNKTQLQNVEHVFCIGDAFTCLGGQRTEKLARHPETLARILVTIFGAIWRYNSVRHPQYP